jgi:hypothetical protein
MQNVVCSNKRNCERIIVCIVSEITCVSCSNLIFGGVLDGWKFWALVERCAKIARSTAASEWIIVFGALRQQPCESVTMHAAWCHGTWWSKWDYCMPYGFETTNSWNEIPKLYNNRAFWQFAAFVGCKSLPLMSLTTTTLSLMMPMLRLVTCYGVTFWQEYWVC